MTRRRNHSCNALSVGLVLAPLFGVGKAHALDSTPSPQAAAALGMANGPDTSQGLPYGGWLIYPSVFLGSVYNDNINGGTKDRLSALGLQIQPRLEADFDNGLHAISIYANGDFQFYPSEGSNSVQATARLGTIYTYSPTPDLSVRFQGDFTRMNGLFAPGFWPSTYQTWQPLNSQLTNGSIFTNEYSGSVSVEKELTDRMSVRVSAGLVYSTFDQPSNDNASNAPLGVSQVPFNGLDYSLAVRGINQLTPLIYTFVETGADIHRYQHGASDANVYRVIGGLGSDLIRLVRGEIYAGYQARFGSDGDKGSAGLPTFGGRISYYPTRYFTISASADQTLSLSDTPSSTSAPPGQPIQVSQSTSGNMFQSRIQADYALSYVWSAYVQAGYGRTQYRIPSDLALIEVWSAGAGLRYALRQNLALTLDYQFNNSNTKYRTPLAFAASTQFRQNVISVGLTYRY